MIKQKEFVPIRRYKEFNEHWKLNKLGDVVEFFNNMRIPIDTQKRSKGIYPYYGATGIIDYVNDYIFEGEYVLLAEDGENILSRNSPLVYLTSGKFWVNNHAHVMNMKMGSNLFLIQLLEKHKYNKYNTGTAQPKLNGEVVKNMTFYFPSIKEQQKIGEFFKHLDEMIALEQRKIDKIKALKSAYLAEMFPAEGELVPKRRFAGNTDEWEGKKLGDIGKTFTGLSGKTKKDFGHGNAEFVTYLNVFNNPISNPSITENVEIDIKQDEVKYGDVLFTTSSETPHEVGMSSIWLYNRPNVYLNSFCFGYRININIDYLFIAYLFRSNMIRKQMKVLAQGISRYNISKNKVMEIMILLPSKKEQQKIGEFFKKLDKRIATHERKLEKLKATKQAYLHEMFV